MIRRILFYGFLSCLAIFILSCNDRSNNSQPVDPYSNIELPIYPKGYNVQKYVNKPLGTKSVNYSIKVKYPAIQVLKYYQDNFREMGWSLSNRDRNDNMEWESFIDSTTNGSPQIRQLILTWRDSRNKNELFLALRYKKYMQEDWNDELNVLCQIHPLVNTSKLDNFIKRLRESKQHEEFMKMLDSYRMSNGEVNIDKALRENPDNSNLREYKKIIDGREIRGTQ
jgi:hypothetical protein